MYTVHKNIKQALSLTLAVSLFLTVLAPVIPKVHAASLTAAPRISFTFDDGLQSAVTQAAPTLAKYGYVGTDYVISGCIGMTTVPNTCHANTNAVYMSSAELTTLGKTYGWEIGGHTKTHPYLASFDAADGQAAALTTQQVSDELTGSVSQLAGYGFTPTDMASPYGDWTFPVLSQIAKSFASHRGFADSIDQGTTPDGIIDHANVFPYNDYLLYDLRVQAGVTVAQVKSFIDQTITSGNQWLVLSFHDIKPTASTNPDDYEYNTADLDAIAAYVKSKNVQVVTVSGALVGGTNLLPASSFDTPLSTVTTDPKVWSTDDATNIKQDTANNGSYPSSQNSVSLTGTTRNIQLYSPQVAVNSAQNYIIKGYLNSAAITVAAGHEIAYYIQEFDAAGVALSPLQYKKSETTVWIESMNFEYKPSSALVKSARIAITVTANSGVKAYVDNFQWISTGAGKAGDANGDGIVGIQDAALISINWGKSGMTRAQGDVSGDGIVGIQDAALVSINWGK